MINQEIQFDIPATINTIIEYSSSSIIPMDIRVISLLFKLEIELEGTYILLRVYLIIK